MVVWGVNWAEVQGLAQAGEAFALVVTLTFLVRQIGLQKRELDATRHAVAFQTYQQLSQRYTDLLWMASDDPLLNCIWEPLGDDDKARLDGAQAQKIWGAWFVMSDQERKCYRYVRSALETFEQAHTLYCQQTLSRGTWSKWQSWIRLWISTRYYPYVMEDSRPRFIPRFARLLDEMEAEGDAPAGAGLVTLAAKDIPDA